MISVCTNLFGISRIVTYLFCFSSINYVVMIASDTVVGLVTYLRDMYTCCVLPFSHILDLIVLCLCSFKKIRLSVALFLSSFVIWLTLTCSKKLSHGSVAFLYAWQRYLFLWSYWCLVSSCIFEESCKLAFQKGQYSCATFSYKWSALTLNYIILFAILFLVNFATFVAVLWLFWLDVLLGCPLRHNIYHPLIARDILHLLDHSLPLNLQTGILQCFLLFSQNNIGRGRGYRCLTFF